MSKLSAWNYIRNSKKTVGVLVAALALSLMAMYVVYVLLDITKVTGEILIMDLLAILTGFALMFLMIFLLNELLYKPSGKYLPYGSGMGILGFFLSNILVVIPTILLKGRKLAKADVTEF